MGGWTDELMKIIKRLEKEKIQNSSRTKPE